MIGIRNAFWELDDFTLKKAMKEYRIWCTEGAIPSNGILAAAVDRYGNIDQVHRLVLLEKDLLYTAALRWLEI